MHVTSEPQPQTIWYPLCRAEDVAEGPLRRRVLGEDLVVWAAGPVSDTAQADKTTVRVARDRCPHRDAALSGGWISGSCIVCPYHGWEYGGDGAAVHIPQLDDDIPIPSRARLVTYEAEVRHGVVWTALQETVRPSSKSLAGATGGTETGAAAPGSREVG